MPRFTVTVEWTEKRRREIAVGARDREQAEERAVEIVEKWDGTENVEAVDVEEE